MELHTARLDIRPLCALDASDVYAYASLPEVAEKAGWRTHESLADTNEILQDWIEEDARHAIVLRDTGRVIGHIAIYPDSEEEREDTRELGFALHPAYQRKGIMREAVAAVTDALFADGIEIVWACCFQDNPASQKLIEKCGFQFVQEGEFHSDSLERDFLTYEYRLCKDPKQRSLQL